MRLSALNTNLIVVVREIPPKRQVVRFIFLCRTKNTLDIMSNIKLIVSTHNTLDKKYLNLEYIRQFSDQNLDI